MKKQNIAGTVLKALVLGSMLVGCQQEDALTPQAGATHAQDQSAKVNTELKLVKDGQTRLYYITWGRFFGNLSKVTGPYQYTNYTYSDANNPNDYWIISKTYNKSNDALTKEVHYLVSNGKCIQSLDVTNNFTQDYKYNEVGRLDQIKYVGNSTQIDFSYIYNSATGTDRLNKITYSNNNGAYKEVAFTYSIGMVLAKPDKYFLNHEHTGLDKYLKIFGKFSDLLVQQVVVKPLPYTNQTKPYYKYFYGIDADGYAISVQRHFHPLGYGYDAGKEVTYSALDYSTSWKGI